MNRSITKTMTALALATTGLLASASSQAGLISYDFTVTIDTVTSPLFNQSFAGSFSYDDAQVPLPGFSGEDLYALASFTFDFAGNVYMLTDLFYGDAAVLGGSFLGLDAVAMDFMFLPASAPFPASFAYDFGTGDFGTGGVAFAEATDAPEPASMLLFGSAVLALGTMQRRRKV